MVTSKHKTGSKTGAIALLFSSAVMLFTLLFGGVAAADQAAETDNVGIGGANTGGNGAAGNGSGNGATSTQTATATGGGDDAVAPNSANSGNTSNGTAEIRTGNANATGNSATNNTQQTVVEGHNGAVVLVDQEATITNFGVGIANTGGNVAVGNMSVNVADAQQTATADGTGGDAVAANNAAVRNNSGGDARIHTGDATATGSTSTNTVNQTYDGSYDGLGVVVLIDQNVNVTNVGIGVANTGLNAAVGNASDNDASADQTSDALNTATGDAVASNNGTASNDSTGSAGIITGDAKAVGNVATNNVSQIVNVNAQGSLGSIVLVDQEAAVTNLGIAFANTGLNLAVGNLSSSTSNAVQGAVSGAGPPADDVVASNDAISTNTSNGSADIRTGNADAAATGNRSHTNLTQAVDVNTNGNAILLTDQSANIANIGIAVANTGGNIAVGNASGALNQGNVATVDQDADAGAAGDADDTVAANFASALNNSNGTASIETGNASATGNAATTNVTQTVDTNATGGFALPDQSVNVVNFGVGIANTGLNAAVGNASVANSTTLQEADVFDNATDDAVASNFADASTNSDGSATIRTGHANSIGNDSAATTTIAQTVDTDGVNGNLSDQEVTSVNVGIGFSNTGLNVAAGNVSAATNTTVQTAAVTGSGDDAVASNFGESISQSNGSADITTGAANSIGNASHTTITQTVDDGTSGAFLLSDQVATEVNFGVGIANTGLNGAVGNASASTSTVNQIADVPVAGTEDVVAANFGTASTDSNGSATVRTGNANAIGSHSTTVVTQTVDHNGSGFALPDQSATAVNIGIGVANTGGNIAVGNASGSFGGDNTATLDQEATVGGALIGDDIVASNDGVASATSNGSAEITTGSANAIGNDAGATLVITQTADSSGAGFTLVDQEAAGVNVGVGIANTGGNLAVGNASDNTTDVEQDAVVDAAGALDADDVVASNNATSSINSDGSARITTGSANAVGNRSTTTIAQTSDFDGEGFALVDQEVVSANVGIGVSNTGFNAAIGNASTSDTTAFTQTAGVAAGGDIAADDVVAANTAANTINTNGTADIRTGNATSIGNQSSDHISQVANTDISGSGFVLSDQSAAVVNLGVGVANTGVNLAVGNVSDNDSDLDQDAAVTTGGGLAADDVVASNALTNTINSDGSASIHTGAAHAIGNDSGSTTVINQISDNNIDGSGFALIDQEATVANIGFGIANSGVNAAIGNASENTVGPVVQTTGVNGAADITADDIVAANSATSTNNSDGTASVRTGDADGVGNKSTTTINQVADANIDGAGFILTDQAADVINAGAGIGNSGINAAVGNASVNTITGTQDTAVAAAGDITADDVVASSTAALTNDSNGDATIETGRGHGHGNMSETVIAQTADDDVDGFVLNDSEVTVANLGLGIGNSGINLAVGNASTNTQTFDVDAAVTSAGTLAADDVVAANSVNAANNSNGSARITTGCACAYGNVSTTLVDAGPDGEVVVANIGIGVANSGINLAVGNLSTNDIDTTADATVDGAVLAVEDDAVASNVITETNNSNGTADITTGDAYALGNRSATGIVDAEDATTINFGLAFANTGLNLGAGNLSENTTTHVATATAPGGVASNVADLNNTSDGSARIRTGNANAFGNVASNATCQGTGFGPTCPQPVLPPLPDCGCGGKPNPGPGPGPGPTPGPTPGPGPGPKPGPNPRPFGHELARTGVNVQTLLGLGLVLLAIGALLRRRARTA